jgi:hypothetical protein
MAKNNREKEPFSELVAFRVTPTMYDALRERADSQMLRLTDIMRQMVARELGMIPRAPTLLVDRKAEYNVEVAE